MKATRLIVDSQDLAPIVGQILCHDVARRFGRGTMFRKGHHVAEGDLASLASLKGAELHLIELEPGDVHEDAAGDRLARAIAGPGVRLSDQKQSRIHLMSEHQGLLSIDTAAVTDLNLIPGVCIYTIYDKLAVDPGEAVAAAKVIPLAVPESALIEAERIAADQAPVVQVEPFRPLAVGVVAREDLEGRAREKFEEAIRRKVNWYGSRVIDIVYPPSNEMLIAQMLRGFARAGAGLIMTAGANAVDPLDPVLRGLDLAGARMEQHGAPAHPGSLFWLAYLGEVPVFGLASCGMYSQATSVDLLLPLVFAGRRIVRADIAALGEGGLLRKDMAFRFPRYGGGEAPEAI